jgi:hypothetical protein
VNKVIDSGEELGVEQEESSTVNGRESKLQSGNNMIYNVIAITESISFKHIFDRIIATVENW